MLSLLLTPFTALMTRMKYAQKFVLISLLFLVPLGLLIGIWSKDLQNQIQDSKKELLGSAYIQGLMPLMLDIQQHRGLANGILNGDTASKTMLADKEKAIEASMARVAEMNAQNGDELQTATAWQAIQNDWKNLEEQTLQLPAKECYDRHTALIGDILDFIVHIADESNLTLDPEVDSYYMMNVMVHQLPQLIEFTGQARGDLNGVLASKKITDDGKVSARIEKALIQTSIQNIEKALNIISESNPTLSAVLEGPGGQSVQSSKGFLATIDKNVLNAASLTMKPSDFFAEGTNSIEISNQFFQVVSTQLDQLLQHRVDRLSSDRAKMMSLVGITILLAALFFLAFYRSVRMTIRSLQHGAERLAGGDLSKQVELQTRDELGEVGVAFNQMTDSLRGILRINQDISEQVAASSEELSAVSTESTSAMQQIAMAVQVVAEGAEQQKKASEENALAMNEMAIGISRIADSASEVSELAVDVSDGARTSEEKLKVAVGQMQTIRHAVHESADVVTRLGEHSKDIGAFVSTIKHLSSQTNLLALNANIEAARAGEYGRGFKVVASEIGKLAGQTQESVESITSIVSLILDLVEGAVVSMKETAAEAELGLSAIQQTDSAISSILDSIRKVAHQIQEVSAASEQMSASAQQVTASTMDMVGFARSASDRTTEMAAAAQEQLASMEEVQASSDALGSCAQDLQDELRKFTLA
ncbi:methyl-accepting chemotaxis protein [Paenibacillus hexagrammi]|uniref:Methyl-accepting chemotaxis protein n=1 Tax=Paenibacillus hexagrammi TaxID=2908839 RepID=A0ABY3SFU4_9BACL|nr:methyl-accepting chemotaxis protein [Paenibacillus sp. YPD9-1]UJF32842.1 methyl-accepting chemotaxis protein [Paenibacillus sp. YPD9-1]